MFGFTTLPMAVAALALFTPASSLVIPRKAAPAGWWTEGLENYDVYHTRYLALSCQTQHNTDFFDACWCVYICIPCDGLFLLIDTRVSHHSHPMLATENLVDNRASYCTPSASASSSAVAAEPTSTVDTGDEGTDEDEDYEWVCDDDEEDDDTPEPSSTKEDTPEPTSTKKVEGAVKDNTPTSIKEAEPTSTKEAEPTSTKEATPTSEDTPEPTETSGGDNNGGSGAYGGEITWYEQGGAAGACGDFHSDSDDIAAICELAYFLGL